MATGRFNSSSVAPIRSTLVFTYRKDSQVPMLDFRSIAKPRRVIVPILGQEFLYEKKHYRAKRSEDGWHEVELSGNNVTLIGPSIPDKAQVISTLGFTHNNNFIFHNYDVAKRNWNLGLMVPLYFNQSQTFES